MNIGKDECSETRVGWLGYIWARGNFRIITFVGAGKFYFIICHPAAFCSIVVRNEKSQVRERSNMQPLIVPTWKWQTQIGGLAGYLELLSKLRVTSPGGSRIVHYKRLEIAVDIWGSIEMTNEAHVSIGAYNDNGTWAGWIDAKGCIRLTTFGARHINVIHEDPVGNCSESTESQLETKKPYLDQWDRKFSGTSV